MQLFYFFFPSRFFYFPQKLTINEENVCKNWHSYQKLTRQIIALVTNRNFYSLHKTECLNVDGLHLINMRGKLKVEQSSNSIFLEKCCKRFSRGSIYQLLLLLLFMPLFSLLSLLIETSTYICLKYVQSRVSQANSRFFQRKNKYVIYQTFDRINALIFDG